MLELIVIVPESYVTNNHNDNLHETQMFSEMKKNMFDVAKEDDFFECQSCVGYWNISQRRTHPHKLWKRKSFHRIQSFSFYFWWIAWKHFVTTNLEIILKEETAIWRWLISGGNLNYCDTQNVASQVVSHTWFE